MRKKEREREKDIISTVENIIIINKMIFEFELTFEQSIDELTLCSKYPCRYLTHLFASLYPLLFSFSVEFSTEFCTAEKDVRNYNRKEKLPLASTSYDSAGEIRAPLDNAFGDTNGQTFEGMPRRFGFPYRYREVVERGRRKVRRVDRHFCKLVSFCEAVFKSLKLGARLASL